MLKSREEFLSLQSSTSTSTDLVDDAGKTSTRQVQSPAVTRITTDPSKDTIESQSESRPSRTVKIALREDDPAFEDEDNEVNKFTPTDTPKSAFPPLVSGRSWDAVVRLSSLSVDEPEGVEQRSATAGQTSVAARLAFATARSETTEGVSIRGRVSRPILKSRSVDAETPLPGSNPTGEIKDDKVLTYTTKTAFPPLEDDGGRKGVPVDAGVKAAFPPLVSGRDWDPVLRVPSSSAEEPGIEIQPAGPRQTPITTLSSARVETTTDRGKVSRPILKSKSVDDTEPPLPGSINVDPAGQVQDDGQKVVPADAHKAAFPPLVSGRSWDAVVGLSSSSVEENTTVADGAERRSACPGQTLVGARPAFSAARAETTAGVSDRGKVSRPILQLAKSVDVESPLPGTVNIDPQLAAVLRMRKQREEELEREESELRAEETKRSQSSENRYYKIKM